MTKCVSSVNGQDWDRLNRLLRSALPVRSESALLAELAEAWLDLTDAKAAFVTLIRTGQHKLAGAIARLDAATTHFENDLPTGAGWSDAVALPPGVDPHTLPSETEAFQSIPFTHEQTVLGGVVLWPRSDGPILGTIVNDLAELSGRLCLQALALSDTGATSRLISTDDELLQAKSRSLAEFAAGAGHEINNPLATIIGRVQLLLRNEQDPERRRALSTIGGQAYRVRDMIGDLMQFGRPPAPSPETMNLTDVCHQVAQSLKEEAVAKTCRIDVHAVPEVPIWADRHQLSVVISCLLKNSMEASRDGGVIQLKAGSTIDENRPAACLSVIDTGHVLSPEEQEHLFDPFYSGRQAGRGLGFGLPKCYRIVQNHGGRIEVDSRSSPSQQTSFRVYWPASPSDNPTTPVR